MEISKLIERFLNIIEKELELLEEKSSTDQLDILQTNKVIDYVRTLVLVEKERVKEEIPEFKNSTDLENEIIKQAKIIEEKRGFKPAKLT